MGKLVVSEVKLTGYQYNKETDTITVSGVTDNFKYLAQQLLVLKTAEGFVSPKVESLKRDKEGKIAFAITAGISSVVQK
jgi:Tfp pilus assembly protein PilN